MFESGAAPVTDEEQQASVERPVRAMCGEGEEGASARADSRG